MSILSISHLQLTTTKQEQTLARDEAIAKVAIDTDKVYKILRRGLSKKTIGVTTSSKSSCSKVDETRHLLALLIIILHILACYFARVIFVSFFI